MTTERRSSPTIWMEPLRALMRTVAACHRSRLIEERTKVIDSLMAREKPVDNSK